MILLQPDFSDNVILPPKKREKKERKRYGNHNKYIECVIIME